MIYHSNGVFFKYNSNIRKIDRFSTHFGGAYCIRVRRDDAGIVFGWAWARVAGLGDGGIEDGLPGDGALQVVGEQVLCLGRTQLKIGATKKRQRDYPRPPTCASTGFGTCDSPKQCPPPPNPVCVRNQWKKKEDTA